MIIKNKTDIVMTPLRQAVENALMKVAHNVQKHEIGRSGWQPNDECFILDLREAEEEILNTLEQEIERRLCEISH